MRIVPRRQEFNDSVNCSTAVNTYGFFAEDGIVGPIEEGVEEIVITLQKFVDLHHEFYKSTTIKFVKKMEVENFFEELVLDYQMNNFNDLQYIVNFGVRSWFAANKEDFQVFIGPDKRIGFMNFKPKIYTIFVMEK